MRPSLSKLKSYCIFYIQQRKLQKKNNILAYMLALITILLKS